MFKRMARALIFDRSVYDGIKEQSKMFKFIPVYMLMLAILGTGCSTNTAVTPPAPTSTIVPAVSTPISTPILSLEEKNEYQEPRIFFSDELRTEIYSVSQSGTQIQWFTENIPENARFASWSPDGTRFAIFAKPFIIISDRDRNLTRYNIFDLLSIPENLKVASPNKPSSSLGGGGAPLSNIDWTADGGALIYSWDAIYLAFMPPSQTPRAVVLTSGDYFISSPDRQKIVIQDGFREGDSYTLSIKSLIAESGEETLLWTSSTTDTAPILLNLSWSYNGEMIAFVVRDPNNGNATLHIISQYGESLFEQVLNNPHPDEWGINDDGYLFQPLWSPTNSSLAFQHENEIYLWQESGLTNLTQTKTLIERTPLWSPDGSKIAYLTLTDTTLLVGDSPHSGGVHDIYMMNSDGSQPNRMTEGANVVLEFSYQEIGYIPNKYPRVLAWSPDGRMIAYAAFGPEKAIQGTTADGNSWFSLTYPQHGIHLLNLSTGEDTYLTNPEITGINPIFTPVQ